MKLGIIQSRGLGDIIIALPIAHHYHRLGWEVHWCVTDSWVAQLRHHARWCTWHAVKDDGHLFYYDLPQAILKDVGVDEVICLYNSLTGHPEFGAEPYFQHVSFDRYKYLRAGVSFEEKWQLKDCIVRDLQRETLLKQSLEIKEPYVITHLTSSEQTVRLPPDLIPPEYRVIPITTQGWIFDWLTVIEQAEALIMTDSVFANLVDQLKIPVEKYFIPQHHIQLTPQHVMHWQWLPNPDLKKQAVIFQPQP